MSKFDSIPIRMDLRVFPNREVQAQAAANLLAAILKDAVNENGMACAALAGGGTPEATYRILSRKRLNWKSTYFFPTDERCVPPDHPRSNAAMLRRLFGRKMKLVPLVEDASPPPADVILLGAGADGHIASLFQDTLMLDGNWQTERGAPASQPEERLSLSFSYLVDMPWVILLICGEEKFRLLMNPPYRHPYQTAPALPLTHLLSWRTKTTVFYAP